MEDEIPLWKRAIFSFLNRRLKAPSGPLAAIAAAPRGTELLLATLLISAAQQFGLAQPRRALEKFALDFR